LPETTTVFRIALNFIGNEKSYREKGAVQGRREEATRGESRGRGGGRAPEGSRFLWKVHWEIGEEWGWL